MSSPYNRNFDPQAFKYAEFINLDLHAYPELLWVAEQGLHADLPDGWSVVDDKERGQHFFLHAATGATQFDHPMDAHFRQLAKTEMANAKRRRTGEAGGGQPLGSSGLVDGNSTQFSGAAYRPPREQRQPPRTWGKYYRYVFYCVIISLLLNFVLSAYLFKFFHTNKVFHKILFNSTALGEVSNEDEL